MASQQTAEAIKTGRLVNGIIEIPVVFNVLYRTTAENISLTQLQSQIDGLDSKVSGEYVELTSKIQDVQQQCESKHKQCEQHCKTIDSKLDRVFKKSQLK